MLVVASVAAVPSFRTNVSPEVLPPNAVGAALGLLGDEWSLLVVQQALLGARRFTDLQRRLGTGPTVLTDRLTALTDEGGLERVPDGGRQAYALTTAGQELWALLPCVWAWEQRWVQGEALPTMRHTGCGAVFTPVLSCRACARPTGLEDTDVQLGPSGALARCVPQGSRRRRTGAGCGTGPGLFPETMALLGSRWSSALLGACFLGVHRFRDLQVVLGAPANVLAERLRTFVALGVLDDGYLLTAKGRDFHATAACLVAWGERHLPDPDGPALLAPHAACGHRSSSSCGARPAMPRSAVPTSPSITELLRVPHAQRSCSSSMIGARTGLSDAGAGHR